MTQLFPGFIEVDSILNFSKQNTWEKARFFSTAPPMFQKVMC